MVGGEAGAQSSSAAICPSCLHLIRLPFSATNPLPPPTTLRPQRKPTHCTQAQLGSCLGTSPSWKPVGVTTTFWAQALSARLGPGGCRHQVQTLQASGVVGRGTNKQGFVLGTSKCYPPPPKKKRTGSELWSGRWPSCRRSLLLDTFLKLWPVLPTQERLFFRCHGFGNGWNKRWLHGAEPIPGADPVLNLPPAQRRATIIS